MMRNYLLQNLSLVWVMYEASLINFIIYFNVHSFGCTLLFQWDVFDLPYAISFLILGTMYEYVCRL
jgi:hypothetical protein